MTRDEYESVYQTWDKCKPFAAAVDNIDRIIADNVKTYRELFVRHCDQKWLGGDDVYMCKLGSFCKYEGCPLGPQEDK